MIRQLCILLLLPIIANSLKLNAENWEETTNGKVVFVKFFAPWCGHCKKLMPAWDKLTENNEKEHVVVAKVDCTEENNKEFCGSNGVRGFPTLKYGNPNDLEDYKGARDYEALKGHLDALTPPCTPTNSEQCTEGDKKMLDSFLAIESKELDTQIEEHEKNLQDSQNNFELEVKKLQETYENLQKEKEEEQSKLQPVLRLMRTAKAHRDNKQKEEL